MIVKGVLYGEEIAILNMYYPPGHQCDFLTNTFSKFVNLNIRNSFIGGDFNCHLCPIMDKSPSCKVLRSSQAKSITAICEELDYVDVWRAQHPADKEFTFFSKVHTCYTRIDYFFMSKMLLQSVTSSSIGNIVISDHAAVFIQCDLKNPVTQSRHWRLNPFILNDQQFISHFVEEFKSFFSINLATTKDSSLLWETSKAYSRAIIISYMSTKRRRQAEQREILESKLKRAETEYAKRSSLLKLKEITALRSALDSLLTKEAESKIRSAKQKIFEHGDKVGKYLAYLTKKKSDSQTISSIADDNGKLFFDSVTINNTFRTFYEKLYKSETHSDASKLMEEFFSSLELPSLSEDHKLSLDAPITKKEVLDAIKDYSLGRRLGQAGSVVSSIRSFRVY